MEHEATELEDEPETNEKRVKGPVPYRVRPYRGENSFVAATWLRGYLSSPFARHISQNDYWYAHARFVSKAIDRCVIFVAEHLEHEDLLLGHAVGERDELGAVLHAVYVKSDYRTLGVGRRLWTAVLENVGWEPGKRVRYTHQRSPLTEIARKQGWDYNPYPFFRYGYEI